MLTIATVTHNCLEYTKLFTEYLERYADVQYKLIVVDNHSTDGTVEFLQSKPEIISIFNKRNMGFGYANNQAFARSKTPYFLGLNNDTVIFPHFLSKLLTIADKHSEFAEFGVASNCIGALNPFSSEHIDRKIREMMRSGMSGKEVIEKYYGDVDAFVKKYGEKNEELSELEVPPHFTGGWCYLVRRDAVIKAGGLFDRQFRIGFYEDADLSWRMKKAGYKIRHISGLYLHHFTHISFNSNKLRQKDSTIARANAKLFANKWSDTIRSFLQEKFGNGMSLKEIATSYHIFGTFFGREREDWDEVERKVKQECIGRKMNFREFLVRK